MDGKPTPADPANPNAAASLPAGVEVVNGQYVFKDADGVSYEWDSAKQAWFPMWQDDLVTMQQSAYGSWEPPETKPPADAQGRQPQEEAEDDEVDAAIEDEFGDSTSSVGQKRKAPAAKPAKPTKAEARPQAPSAVVYVSGLPEDVTVGEMKEFFGKCGLIKIDFETEQPKIKIYRDKDGRVKGDGWVSYLKHESVPLAIQILDGADLRPGVKVAVSEAHFDHHPDDGKKRRKVDKRMIQQKLQQMEKKLQWYDEGGGVKAKYTRIVILKHMFAPEDFEADPGLMIDLKEDIRGECEKLGEVTSIMLFDKTEDGVCSVKFKTEEAAKACVELMNGRFFAGRRVEAETYDGKTKYTSKVTGEDAEKEEAKRLEKFAKWLEGN